MEFSAGRSTSLKELERIKNEIDAFKKHLENIEIRMNVVQHTCSKEEVFRHIIVMLNNLQSTNEKMISELGSWKFFRRSLLPILGLIVTLGIAAIVSVVSLRSDVVSAEENSRNAIEQVQIIIPSYERLKTNIDNLKGDGAKKFDKILEEIERLESHISIRSKKVK